MKYFKNKLFLLIIPMLPVIFISNGCEFESAGDVSQDLLFATEPTPPPPSCTDGIDNNGDGLTDLADPGCQDTDGDGSYDDATGEFYLPFCNDGVNNDSTGVDGIPDNGDEDDLIDLLDPDCRLSDNGKGEIFTDPPVLPSFCEDGEDNDLDGDTDLADSDCVVGGPGEIPAPPALPGCEDGIDNDGDGLTDADDTGDCTAPGTGESYLPNCNDGEDNDEDGLTDADDTDCQGGSGEQIPPPPPPAPPNCTDGIDNDGDGLTDADDTDDCAASGTGEYYLSNCNDGVDNDGDGLTDLADGDCKVINDGAGEFLPPLVIPPAVAVTNASVEEVIASGEVDSTSQAGQVFAASDALTDPTSEEGQANAEAVVLIETGLAELAGADPETVDFADTNVVAAFTASIAATIEETGELPPLLNTPEIDALMAEVEADPVLSELLSSFYNPGGGRSSSPPISPPLSKTFGAQDYQECIDACLSSSQACSESCYSGYMGLYDGCLDNANDLHSSCSEDVVTNYDDCIFNSDTRRTTCISTIDSVYTACTTTANLGAQDAQADCIDDLGGAVDSCDAASLQTFHDCSFEVTNGFMACFASTNEIQAANMATAEEEFNRAMVLVEQLRVDLPDHADMFMTVCLIRYMGDIAVNTAALFQGIVYCTSAQTLGQSTCQLEHLLNEAVCLEYGDATGCDDYITDVDYTSCDEYSATNLAGCNTEFSLGIAGCGTIQNNTNTACSAQLTAASGICYGILSIIDCGYCSDNYEICTTTCHDQMGSGGGG